MAGNFTWWKRSEKNILFAKDDALFLVVPLAVAENWQCLRSGERFRGFCGATLFSGAPLVVAKLAVGNGLAFFLRAAFEIINGIRRYKCSGATLLPGAVEIMRNGMAENSKRVEANSGHFAGGWKKYDSRNQYF